MNVGDHQAHKGKSPFVANGTARDDLDFATEPAGATLASRHSPSAKPFSQTSFEQVKNGLAVASVLARVDWPVVTRELGLSNQEIAVVKHVLAGEKMATIAGDLCLSLGTVKTYCQRIYHKLQVSDHCGLAIVVLGCALLREVRGQDEAKG